MIRRRLAPPPWPAAKVIEYQPRPRTPAASTGLVSALRGLPGAAESVIDPIAKTPAERAHHARVAALRCVLCRRLGLAQESITDVHHLRDGHGMQQRASHWMTAGLCHDRCHQGPRGVHGDRSLLKQAGCTEVELVAWTIAELYGGHGVAA